MILRKMKNHWLIRFYQNLSLGGKVAVPVLGIFLIISVLKTIKWAFWLGLIGLVAYFGLSAFLYFKDKNRR